MNNNKYIGSKSLYCSDHFKICTLTHSLDTKAFSLIKKIV